MSFFTRTCAERALPVFRANNWTYGKNPGMDVVQLEEMIEHLVQSVRTGGKQWVSSGRFTVTRDDGISVMLELGRRDYEASPNVLYVGDYWQDGTVVQVYPIPVVRDDLGVLWPCEWPGGLL